MPRTDSHGKKRLEHIDAMRGVRGGRSHNCLYRDKGVLEQQLKISKLSEAPWKEYAAHIFVSLFHPLWSGSDSSS